MLNNKFSKLSVALILSGALSSSLFADTADGQTTLESFGFSASANLTLASDYIWRGMSQTKDGAAVQGGIDLGHESGLYIGTWASNVSERMYANANAEFDLYLGFARNVDAVTGLSYDVNYLRYFYVSNGSEKGVGDTSYDELTLSLGYEVMEALSVGASYTYNTWLETGDDAGEMNYFKLSADYDAGVAGISVSYGMYNTIGTDMGAFVSTDVDQFTLSAGVTVFSADDESGLDDETHFVVSVGTGF